MNIQIRFARSEDFTLVRTFDPHSASILEKRIHQKLQADEILLATVSGELVGLLRFSYFWSNRPYIDLIWVSSASRRQGVGVALLRYLEEHVRREGYRYLYSSSQENEKESQEWHLRQGFQQCGVLTGINLPEEVGEVFFVKKLNSEASESRVR